MGSTSARLQQWIRVPPRPHAQQNGDQIDSMTASAIVDLALRACELSLSCGSSSADATATALTICEAYGLKADVDVTWTSIYISYHRFGAAEPITGFRTVRTRGTDYQQLAHLGLLERDIAKGRLTVTQARAKFDHIRDSASPYRGWLVALASGALGGAVAALLGGVPFEWLLAGIASLLLYLVQRLCLRAGLAPLFVQAFAAAVPTTMALAIMRARETTMIFYDVSPSMIAASGMVSLLAGLGVATAARDAMDGNFLTSAARTFDAVLQTVGIIFGVVITLWIGVRAGVPGYIAPLSGYAAPTPWQILGALVCAASFAVVCHVGPRSVPFCALLGALGYAVFQLVLPLVGVAPAAAGVGAVVVGAVGQALAWRWHVPMVALITTGIVSMLPGMALYRGLYAMFADLDSPNTVEARILLTQVVMTAVTLAAGSMLGSQMVRPFGQPAEWLMRHTRDKVRRRQRPSVG